MKNLISLLRKMSINVSHVVMCMYADQYNMLETERIRRLNFENKKLPQDGNFDGMPKQLKAVYENDLSDLNRSFMLTNDFNEQVAVLKLDITHIGLRSLKLGKHIVPKYHRKGLTEYFLQDYAVDYCSVNSPFRSPKKIQHVLES